MFGHKFLQMLVGKNISVWLLSSFYYWTCVASVISKNSSVLYFLMLCFLESFHVETEEKVRDTTSHEESHMENLEECVVRAKSFCYSKNESF